MVLKTIMIYKEITIDHLRGNLVEATSTASACIVSSLGDNNNRTTNNNNSIGKPSGLTNIAKTPLNTKTPLLSAGHPFQVLSLLTLEEIRGISLTDDEIAVCSGSYAATTFQQAAFDSLCSKMATRKEIIRCGERGRVHPCTAFHSLIAGCSAKMGQLTESYRDLESPVQRAIIDGLLRMSKKLRAEIEIVTDQCGIPSIALPLQDIAGLYANLSTGGQLPERYKEVAAKLTYSIKSKPLVFAPQSTIEGAILLLTEGDVILRTAENGLAAGTTISKSSGLAVKCNNGCQKTAALVTLALLINLSHIRNSEKAGELLNTLSILKNDSGKETGSLRITIR